MNEPKPLGLPPLDFHWDSPPGVEDVIRREWLVTNGLGGYASGTVALCNTRRYHGVFIPTLTGRGRTVMLARIKEEVVAGDQVYRLDAEELEGGDGAFENLRHLRQFRLDGLIPTWEFELGGARLLRRLVMIHGENTVFVAYRHLGGRPLKLRLRPFPCYRPHDEPVGDGASSPEIVFHQGKLELRTGEGHRPLRLRLMAPAGDTAFICRDESTGPLCYRVERSRGYDHTERQLSPGYFRLGLRPGETALLGVTISGWEVLDRPPEVPFDLELQREARLLKRTRASSDEVSARLVLAADQYIIEPFTRPADEAWARATGQDARSVIAGYPWFTDWGRDTMISLEGLTLVTGREREAAAILRTFRHYVRDGLLPNMFPEGETEGRYNTADATLWFFHAIDRYLERTRDFELVKDFFPTLEAIVDAHQRGTRFNIRCDTDGLVAQGQEGLQLTWMDAKVNGWVVTPRRGKAVEINALWFNALRLMADWAMRLGSDPKRYAGYAEQVYGSFNARFWNEQARCLYDVVDGPHGDDPAVRPNQVFAISLRYPVLRRERWEPVMAKIREDLLTPVGLRSLERSHADYKAKYDGDLRSRDAAYHQGTVWGYLIGHYVDAVLKLNPDKAEARKLLLGLVIHLRDGGIGQISEVFDASEPFRPRGCIAQAWSVAEFLRLWAKTAID